MKRQVFVLSIILAAMMSLVPMRLSCEEKDEFLAAVLADKNFAWESLSDGYITIYYQDGSFAREQRMKLLAGLKTNIPEVLDILGETGYSGPLNVFYLESRDEMESIVGRPYTGFAHWTAHSIFVVVNPHWRSFERHEFAHVVTMGSWGTPSPTSRWMIEGIPVYCDGWCQEYSVGQIAYEFLKTGQLPGLSALFDDPAGLGEIRAGMSSASFVGFILDSFGPGKLRDLWKSGSDRIEQVLGGEVDEIEKAWIDHIKRNASGEIEVDLESIERNGCGVARKKNGPDQLAERAEGLQDPLLEKLAGKWLMRGTIAGAETTHDIESEWVLGHNYIRLHEVSRETTPVGDPEYEAIVFIGWDESLNQYACLWLDSTGGSGLRDGSMGHADRGGDEIAFVFKVNEEYFIHNTFSYDRDEDAWEWRIDNEKMGKRSAFARVVLKRK